MPLLASVPVRTTEGLQSLLDAHTAECRRDLRKRPGAPLYAARVRYVRERPGRERWQLPSETRARGLGDCEDLGTFRAAELQLSGEDPGARATFVRTGPNTLHCIVRRGNGRIEDPSKRLGMGQRTEVGVAESTTIKWNVTRNAAGVWVGEITLPFDLRKVGGMAAATTVRATGNTRGSAAGRTLKAVDSVLSSPLVQAMLPPGASLALNAAKNVAKMFSGLFKKKKKRAALSGRGITPASLTAELRRRGVPNGVVMLGALCAEDSIRGDEYGQEQSWSSRG